LDADIVADLMPSNVRPLLKGLGDDWYADENAIREAIASRASFNLISLSTAMKVDIFIPKLRRFEGGQFARADRKIVDTETGDSIPVASAEDTIAAKLEWFRLGGEHSDRQWQDIVGVIAIQGARLNLDVLRESAAELNVADLLKRALADANDSSSSCD
jgi:hypothetical protein